MSFARALRANTGFGAFWLGYCFTVLGDSITRTTLIWFVFEETNSTVAVGWLSFCLTAPVVFGGMVAGALLDRYDRRYVIAADSLVKAILVVSIPMLSSFEMLSTWYVYAVASLFGFLMMIPLAGVPSMVPAMVEKTDLNAANALETVGYTLGGVFGPPLAGYLIVALGRLEPLYLDCFSYLLFAAAVWNCRPRSEPSSATAPKGRVSLWDAALIIFKNPVLLSTTSMYLVVNVALGSMLVIIPVFAETILLGGAAYFGILLGCISVGELLGSIVTGHLRLPIAEGLAICIAAVLSGLSLGFAALFPQAAVVGLALAAYGFFMAPLTIWGQTLRMKIIPREYHGRCFAIMRTLMQSGGPLGGVAAGFAVPALGVRAAIAGAALIAFAVGAAGLAVAELRRAR